MAVYPSISKGISLVRGINFSTSIKENAAGSIIRKQNRTYPLRTYNIKHPGINYTNAVTLYQFFIARAGMFEDFVIFDDNAEYSYVKEYVGTGDGSTTLWDLPSLSATSRTLYIDDVAKTEGVHWGFYEASGTDGEDRANISSAPAIGERITFSFTGRLKIRAIFGTDELSFEEFYTLLHNFGIPIRGLLNT